VITGRGPGAPSATPDMVFTLRESASGQAVDLTAIRHTDELIDLLGSRRLRRPHTAGDSALKLLCSLAADVDSPRARVLAADSGRVTADGRHAARAGTGRGRGAAGARARRGTARHAAPGEWVGAAAAAIMVATAVTLLAVAGLLVAGMLLRLGGMPARLRFRRPGRPPRGA
jgi:hypothetical protein